MNIYTRILAFHFMKPVLPAPVTMTAKSNGDAIDEATRLLAPAETSPATKTFAGLGESREEERNNGYASYGTQLPETGDEESQVIPPEQDELYNYTQVLQVVVVLLIGMFVSNADGSLVMATHPLIASEFNDLEDSSWLFISFSLAGAATQGLVREGPIVLIMW